MSEPGGESEEELRKYEQRAPGWVRRCLTCGLTEPYGKYGIRLYAAGEPRKLMWCSRCKKFRCHIVQKRRAR